MVEFLLNRGADSDKGMFFDDKYGIFRATPLHVAAENGHAEIIELLLAKGADIEARDGDDARGREAEGGNLCRLTI